MPASRPPNHGLNAVSKDAYYPFRAVPAPDRSAWEPIR